MPRKLKVSVQDIRGGIVLALPLMEMIASRTANKVDDALVVTLRVIATNDEIAKAIEAAIAKGEGAFTSDESLGA